VSGKVRIFCSYAHEDAGLQDQLRKHLGVLQELIESWYDRDIHPGDRWEDAISEQLERADIILLLVSVDFLSSRYCMGVELARALERAGRNEAVVIPVLLRPVDCDNAPFRHLQFLPSDRRPVVKWGDRDDAFLDIERGVRRVVERLRPAQAAPPVADIGPVNIESPAMQQDRMLDAAMAARVPMGKPTDLAVMVRRLASPGLKGVLEVTGEYSGRPEDVRSKAFRIEFPTDDRGHPKPAGLTLRLESPDFDPPSQTKKLLVPPDADSEVCTFLLTPLFTGELVVNLEVYAAEGQQTSRMFRVVAEASDRVVVKGRMLVSVPISTAASAPQQASRAAAATAMAAPQILPRPVAAPRAEAPPVSATQALQTPPPMPAPSPEPRELSSYPPVGHGASTPIQNPYRRQSVEPPCVEMPPQGSAAPARKKNFTVPLTTAAAVVMMAGVGSVYLANRSRPEGSVMLPSVTPRPAPPNAAKRDPAPDHASDPIAAQLPGEYTLQSTNLKVAGQVQGAMEIRRIGANLFTFQTILSVYAGGTPLQYKYAGLVEKQGSAWYVNTKKASDPTIALGPVRNEISLDDNALTFRADNGMVMAWHKR
jgi:hypothetical protein